MLRLTYKINHNEPITDIAIIRLSPNNPKNKDICLYRVAEIKSYLKDLNNGIRFDLKLTKDKYKLFDIECPYGDADILVRDVIEKLIKYRKKIK